MLKSGGGGGGQGMGAVGLTILVKSARNIQYKVSKNFNPFNNCFKKTLANFLLHPIFSPSCMPKRVSQSMIVSVQHLVKSCLNGERSAV